ncbi:MAG: hypothetical protein E7261_10070 [Lachnospiraceae bacterium]|nr:hypothetical protein [Lachnospiraceae bacterium]
MKRLCMAFVVAFFVFLCSCKPEENKYGFDVVPTSSAAENSSNAKTSTTEENSANTQETTTSEDIPVTGSFMEHWTLGDGMSEKLGVSKNLVFIVDWSVVKDVDPRIYEKFNELLVNKYGCDFTVEFRGYRTSKAEDYQKEIRALQISGEQVDIFDTGVGTIDVGNTYDTAIADGLLEPLDNWLGTEYGKKLWSSYPEKIWTRVCRNGEYYGVLNHENTLSEPKILINSKYIKDERDVENIKTIEDVFSFIDSLGEIEDGVIPLIADLDSLYGFEEGYSFYTCILGRENNGKWEAYFALEDEEYLSYITKMREYGIAKGISQSVAKTLGKFVVMIGGMRQSEYSGHSIKVKENSESSEYKELEVYECASTTGWFEYLHNAVVGIASWSEYKEEALQLLALIASEPELSNLLAYGLEGVHYTIEDGRVVYLDYDYNKGRVFNETFAYGNYMITAPSGLETSNKISTFNSYNIKLGIASKNNIDLSAYNTLKFKIDLIYTNKDYANWLYKDNYMELLEEMRSKMKTEGIDELINEINRQLDEVQK